MVTEITDVASVNHNATLEHLMARTLHVDSIYQRPVSEGHVRKITRKFDPDLFGVLVVSERADGERYILDGQHRICALQEMGWIEQTVPCLVYHDLTQQDEARIFSEAQMKRLKLHPREVFRARLAANDPVAWDVKNTAEEFGFTLGLVSQNKSPGNINAISSLVTIREDYKHDDLRTVLSLCHDAWGSECDGLVYQILMGIAMFNHRYRDEYDRDRLVRVLEGISCVRLLADAIDHARFSKLDQRKGVALAIRAMYNKGRSKTRLDEWSEVRDTVSTEGA